MKSSQKSLFFKHFQLFEQRVIIAESIQHDNRLPMESELCVGKHFEELIHGTESAGKHHEGIGQPLQRLLPFAHRLHPNLFGNILCHNGISGKEIRNHPHHTASASESGLGGSSHQSDFRATIVKRHATARALPAQLGGKSAIFGVMSFGGRTK